MNLKQAAIFKELGSKEYKLKEMRKFTSSVDTLIKPSTLSLPNETPTTL